MSNDIIHEIQHPTAATKTNNKRIAMNPTELKFPMVPHNQKSPIMVNTTFMIKNIIATDLMFSPTLLNIRHLGEEVNQDAPKMRAS